MGLDLGVEDLCGDPSADAVVRTVLVVVRDEAVDLTLAFGSERAVGFLARYLFMVCWKRSIPSPKVWGGQVKASPIAPRPFPPDGPVRVPGANRG
jgi:hypothetical protein